MDGHFQLLPWHTMSHQRLVLHLFDAVRKYLSQFKVGGTILPGPLPVLLRAGTIREPDLVYLSAARLRRTKEYPQGADLVIEVVSNTSKGRLSDPARKRADYAGAQVAEYWIVDARKKFITVFTLVPGKKRYKVHGRFTSRATATSVYFPGFSVNVGDLFTPASRS